MTSNDQGTEPKQEADNPANKVLQSVLFVNAKCSACGAVHQGLRLKPMDATSAAFYGQCPTEKRPVLFQVTVSPLALPVHKE